MGKSDFEIWLDSLLIVLAGGKKRRKRDVMDNSVEIPDQWLSYLLGTRYSGSTTTPKPMINKNVLLNSLELKKPLVRSPVTKKSSSRPKTPTSSSNSALSSSSLSSNSRGHEAVMHIYLQSFSRPFFLFDDRCFNVHYWGDEREARGWRNLQ